MNLFDQISENLTDMMVDVSQHADPRCKALMKRLEVAHAEACRASRDVRQELARTGAAADDRQRRVA